MQLKFETLELTLRSTREEDLEFVQMTEALEENRRFISRWTAEKHRNAIDSGDYWHAIIENKDESVGFIILSMAGLPHGSIEFLRIVVSKKNQGIGRKVLKAVKKISFEHFHAHRLWLDVKTFNERAINLYKSEGFSFEGTLRECVREGGHFESLFVFSLLENEYVQLSKDS